MLFVSAYPTMRQCGRIVNNRIRFTHNLQIGPHDRPNCREHAVKVAFSNFAIRFHPMSIDTKSTNFQAKID